MYIRRDRAVKQDGTAYIDNKEYNTLNGNWTLTTLSRVHNPEGYYSYNTSPYTGFIYTRKDHLGSIREVWHAESNKTIQRTQYYPSGLAWETTSDDNLSTQPYKYNGKEFVEMHGYNGLDYGARTYFADRNGWGSVDPLAEKYYSISPYAYCAGNPVRFIDPDGRGLWDNVKNVISSKIDQAKTEVKQVANKVVQKVANTLKSAQISIKENKSEILNVAQSLQTTGDNTVKAGIIVAAVGAPVAGVGAAPGLALAASGAAISTTGKFIEGVVNLVSGNANEVAKTAVGMGVDAAVSNTVNKLLPGSNVGILGAQSLSIKTAVSEVTSTVISNFNTDTIDNYIFKINN